MRGADVALGVGEHVPPRRLRRLHAEAQERQRRLGDDRGRDGERRVHHDRADDVRDDVPDDDPRTATRPTARAASTNSFSFSDSTCPRTTRATYIQKRHGEHEDDRDVGLPEVLERDREDRDRRARSRNRSVKRMSSLVGRPARSTRRPHRPRCPTTVEMTATAKPILQRDLPGVEQPAELVAAELVGAEPVRAVRAPPGRGAGPGRCSCTARRSSAPKHRIDQHDAARRSRPSRPGGGGTGGGTAATAIARPARRGSPLSNSPSADGMSPLGPDAGRRHLVPAGRGARSPSSVVGRHDEPDPRVEHAVEHVGEQVEQDDEDRGDDRSTRRAPCASPASSESKNRRPIPGIEKIFSVMMRPPNSAPMSSAITVTSGISALRSPCLTITLRRGTPLARAVRM